MASTFRILFAVACLSPGHLLAEGHITPSGKPMSEPRTIDYICKVLCFREPVVNHYDDYLDGFPDFWRDLRYHVDDPRFLCKLCGRPFRPHRIPTTSEKPDDKSPAPEHRPGSVPKGDDPPEKEPKIPGGNGNQSKETQETEKSTEKPDVDVKTTEKTM